MSLSIKKKYIQIYLSHEAYILEVHKKIQMRSYSVIKKDTKQLYLEYYLTWRY